MSSFFKDYLGLTYNLGQLIIKLKGFKDNIVLTYNIGQNGTKNRIWIYWRVEGFI